MPTLADIYSLIDSAKRRAADTVQNPGASLSQFVESRLDPIRNLGVMSKESAEETARTGQLFGPKMRQLGEKYAEAYDPIGMTVYHGSPHIFERFDLGKIGTGEGAQAYGRGLYMAQNPKVAEEYQKATSRDKFKTSSGYFDPSDLEHLNVKAELRKGNLEKAIEIAKKYGVADSDYPETAAKAARDLAKLQQLKASGGIEANTGAFYKVDLPDTHIRRMLDWDEPLKNQPAPVRKLAKSLGMDMNDLGGDLLAKVGKGEQGKQILEKAGIRGIKYLDEGSRFSPYEVEILYKGKPYASSQYSTKQQAEQYAKEKKAEGFDVKHKMAGTRNFVVFDPNHLTILERNSEKLK